MQRIIKSEDTKNLLRSDIVRIAEIEQDGWAHGIWEYRKCNDCWHIHSKQDIYNYLPRETYTHTVKHIQALLWNPHIPCKICNGDTSEIYGQQYIESVQARYREYTSFLTTFRDHSGEIQWFLDGYISDFDTIYKNEFKSYYDGIGKEVVRKWVEKQLWQDIPEKMLVNSAMCISEKYKSMYITYDLMKTFYTDLLQSEWDILWIYEASIWSNTHAIYHALWGRSIWIWWNPNFSNNIKWTNTNCKSDIGIRRDIARACRDWLQSDLKLFIKEHKSTIKKIIEMGKN